MVWDDLRVFLALHRQGTHAGAARALGVDATTLGRRIAALEAGISVRLFERTPGGLVPTGAGRTLMAHAERVELEFLSAERELGGADARLDGVVRLTGGDGLLTYLVVPRLFTFRERHPGIDVMLTGDIRALDISRREADVALRLSRPREASLIARRIGRFQYGIYGGQSYIGRHGQPRSARELGSHVWLSYDSTLEHIPDARWLREHVPEPRFALRTNQTVTLVSACAAGHGLAVLPTAFEIADPRLTRLLPRAPLPTRDLWMVFHRDLRTNARVTALCAWLVELFAESISDGQPPAKK